MTIHLYGILARHVLRQVLIPFFCCFFGFLFLFLISDLQDELSDMLKLEHTNYFEVCLYFLYILPEKIPLILPMSLLLGTMYSFSNLNRHNEISAIRSSGISIPQLSVPIFFLSLCISFMLFSSNEYFQSFFDKEASRLHEVVTGKSDKNKTVSFSVNSDDGQRIWNLTFEDQGYSRISLAQNDTDGNPMWTVDASKGDYTDEGWSLKNATITQYNKEWFPSAPEKHSELKLENIQDDPVLMENYHNLGQHLTLAEIDKRLNSNVQFSPRETRILTVKYYSMIFTPFACMISVLLGIPLSITQQRQGAMASAAKALGIMIGYYIIVQLFQYLGNGGRLPALVAGAFPTLSFLVRGIYISLKK